MDDVSLSRLSLSRFALVRALRDRRVPVAFAGLLLAMAGVLVPAGPASAAYPTTSTFLIYCLTAGDGGYIHTSNRCPSGETLVGSAQFNLQWQNRSVSMLAGSYVQSFYPKRKLDRSVDVEWEGHTTRVRGGSLIKSATGDQQAPDGTQVSISGFVIDGSRVPGGIKRLEFRFLTLPVNRNMTPFYVVNRP